MRLLAAAAMAALALPVAAARADTIPGQYIVVYKQSVDAPTTETASKETRDGFAADLNYSKALKGFSAHLSPAQVSRLQADADVAAVVPDTAVEAVGDVAAGETVPTGLRRMQAASPTTARDASSVNVAVIDTGVDLTHPDLNAVAGKNCVTPGTPPNDDNGHGSHIAGTIGAWNTGAGVLGVAPGTRVFAVKVLDASKNGSASQVICGVDWVTSTRTDADPTNDIAVANMSLAGSGAAPKACALETDPFHKAICNSVAAGVTYVVAAGNNAVAFDSSRAPVTPAVYPEVLTVTAMSDNEGVAGATGGAPTCKTGEMDDRYASFSNWASTTAGQAHTIAAPGVCISSTYMNGGYATMSGTSMASPHLAGVIARCYGEGGAAGPCAGLTPAQIVAKMRADAQQTNASYPWYGFTGDPLHAPVSGRYYGYLAYAGAGAPVPPPPVPVSKAPASVTTTTGKVNGTASTLALDDTSWLKLTSTTTIPRVSSWYGSFTAVPTALKALSVTYKGMTSAACSQTMDIYRWTAGTWETLDTRTIGTAAVLIADRVPLGSPSDYVSPAGEVRVRLTCSSSISTFIHSSTLLKITSTAAG